MGPPNKVQEKNFIVDEPGDLGYSGIMTNIIYKDKKHKLPFEIKSHSTTMVKRTNGLSGQSTELPQFAALVYDHTMYMSMMTEMKDKAMGQGHGFSDNQDDWQIVRNGIDFFRRYFAKEYMVLLD